MYAKFSSRGYNTGVNLYHHARLHEYCTSELDIEISSVEYAQFIVGFSSDIKTVNLKHVSHARSAKFLISKFPKVMQQHS